MFSRGKSPETDAPMGTKMATGARNTTFSIIGSDVVITGNISASVDLHVDGQIEGDLKCASLVQGEGSAIRGSVVAETARIAGVIEGSIEARDLVIERTALVTGDVTYENITIEQGGEVDGRLTRRGKSADLQLVSDSAAVAG